DGFLCRLFFLRRKNARQTRKFRTSDFASRTARSNFDGRIVADALIFSGVIAGLDVQFSVALSKPYGCVNWHAALSEGCKRDIFLALDLEWNHRMSFQIRCLCGQCL